MRSLKRTNRSNRYSEREGYWETYYYSGELELTGNYVNGQEEGIFSYYHDNGNLESKGNYVNGIPNGYWEYYYENGKIESKGNLKEGGRDGIWETYDLDGVLFRKEKYNNGVMVEYGEGSRWIEWNKQQPVVDGNRVSI